MEKIKIVKLKTNEDLICGVKEQEDSYMFFYPMTVYIELDQRKNTQNLVMNFWLPYNLSATQEVEIKKTEILAVVEPNEEFKEYYLAYINSLDDNKSVEVSKEELKVLLEKMDANHFSKIH